MPFVLSPYHCLFSFPLKTIIKTGNAMNRISEVTKRDIKDIFSDGIEIYEFLDTRTLKYYFCGRLSEVDFLNRLFNLKDLPSLDTRYKNAEEEISYHSFNDDYSYDWIFCDRRFGLMSCNDEDYLRFICEIFHPAVRKEEAEWNIILDQVNHCLRNDGYEIYPYKKISNKDTFSWRIYSPCELTEILPFSIRCRKQLESESPRLSIPKRVRRELYQFMNSCNETYRTRDESGWDYDRTTIEDVFDQMRKYYIPKCYDKNDNFVETDDFESFMMGTAPKYVFDAIEIFSQNCSDDTFQNQINSILIANDIPYELKDGQMVNRLSNKIMMKTDILSPEAGLRELLQESINFMNIGNYQLAIEKIWDAFERLKSYFCSDSIDKKKSIEMILDRISGDNAEYRNFFNNEFIAITEIGNKYRIRHHEITKIEIPDDKYRKYFYKKCYTLITTTLEFL